MTEHILFLTGKLAESRLRAVIESMEEREFSYDIHTLGVSVAALMTVGMLDRRLESVGRADRVILPGLCRGELSLLSEKFQIPFQRGSDDLKDLPQFFGKAGSDIKLDKYDVQIFAEIVEAAEIPTEQILERAEYFRNAGANVIDLGCLPETEFPHLEESIKLLKDEGFSVSVDSMDEQELLRAGQAGADFLLSLKESSLWISEEVAATPVIIPEEHGDLDSLYRVMEALEAKNQPYIADSILDPIHFGFAESLKRYIKLRQDFPVAEIMMGTGNLTELTEADTSGINAVLFGFISELGIRHILATEVSEHARSAVREADVARRMFYHAREHQSLPKGVDASLLTTHERKPFPYSIDEIKELASEIRDPSYRVQVSESEIHVFNRDGLISNADPFQIFPRMTELEGDPAHAFYMGYELAKAEIALKLGKRYNQDAMLNWGAAVPDAGDDRSIEQLETGTTLQEKKNKNGKN